MYKWEVNELNGEFSEYILSQEDVIKDIIVGSLFYLIQDVFNFHKSILDIKERMIILINTPRCGLAKTKAFMFFLEYITLQAV